MILTFDSVWWFADIIRSFFSAIDYVVYSLLSWIIEGIFNLSNLMVDPVFVKTIYNRVYVIVGIFMVFKISFSFLQYMVSPDSMSDKEKGVGKLIVRAITMLAILVILPVIFFNQDLVGEGKGPILNVLQTGVIKTLPKVILGISDESPEGGTSTENSVTLNADEYGNFMAIKMLSSFYYPEKCRRAQEIISELPNNATDEQKADAEAQANKICSTDSDYISDFNDFLATINMDEDDNPDTYDYQYMWPLTTVAGIALVVIILGMAVDVAIRTFKLILLQMIAPVPVMMYIDPKGAKDGAFNSWLKMFTSTYLDLFVKLGSVYILLVLVSKMFAGNGTGLFAGGFGNIQGFMSRNFVRVFLIIGLFKFAKDIPKFIKDAMGMKDSGGGMFDGMKSLGAAAGLAGGALVGGIAGAKGGFAAAKAQGKGNGKAALSGLGSAIAGMGRGGHQGFTGAGKNGNLLKGFAAASAAQGALNNKKLDAAKHGSTFGGRMKTRFDRAMTGMTDFDKYEKQIKDYDDAKSATDAFKNVLESEAGKANDLLNVAGFGSGLNIKNAEATLAAARTGDAAALSALKNYGWSKTVTRTHKRADGSTFTSTAVVGDLTAAEAGIGAFKKAYQAAYYDQIVDPRSSIANENVTTAKANADAAIKGLGLEYYDKDVGTMVVATEVTAKNSGGIKDSANNATISLKNSEAYKTSKADAEYTKKSGK